MRRPTAHHPRPTRRTSRVRRIARPLRSARIAGRLLLLAVAALTCTLWSAAGPAAAGVPYVPEEASSIQPAPTITHGPTDLPRIALTFDDNYDLPRAYRTLDVLKEMKVPATVFVIGHYQDLGPDLSHRLAADGLEIGDHTRSHADVTSLSWRALQIEIGDGTRTFTELTGRPTVPLFRPPGGYTNEVAATAAAAQGFRSVVLWDIETNDWRGASAAAITDAVLSQAHNGAIVLMHLAAPHTAEALPGIISGLRQRGYELVTVTDLLKGGRRFVDVDPATAEGQTILRAVEAGYLSGVDADYFGPFDRLTRADLGRAAVVATGAAGSTGSTDSPDYVSAAERAGLLPPPPAGSDAAAAAGPLDRLQLAQAIARMARTKGYGAEDTSTTSGGDAATPLTDVPADAAADVGLAIDLGLMTPAEPGRFGSETPVQRRHLATVLARFVALPILGEPTVAPSSDDAAAMPGGTGSDGGVLARIVPDSGRQIFGAIMVVGFALAAALVGLRVRAQANRRKARAARRRAGARYGGHPRGS